MRMNNLYVTIVGACMGLVLLGIGCGAKKNVMQAYPAIQIESGAHIFAQMPTDWGAAKFNALYRDPQSPSGFGYLQGAVNVGIGPKNDKGEIVVKGHVILVPRAEAKLFEVSKYPANAERKFEAGPFIGFVSVTLPNDIETEHVLASVEVRE